MFIERHITEAIRRRAEDRSVVVLTGARQVGKTTLLKHMLSETPYVSFDDMRKLNQAIEQPQAFLELNPPPVFIDEIQYAPELFPYIKLSVDADLRKGRYYLSGSQRFHMMEKVTESLAGRAGILELMGMSLREIDAIPFRDPFMPTNRYLSARSKVARTATIPQYWQTIHRGSMPELVARKLLDKDEFYADYVATYLERDVRKLAQVGDRLKFTRFMGAVAAMTAQMLNLSALARDIGISQPTAGHWLSILEASGLVYLLQPYYNNAIKRVAKTPKVYFIDTGLATHLTHWTSSETLSAGAVSGAVFETFVVGEILKSYRNAGREPSMYYFRSGTNKEIDLVFSQDNTLYPVEIKQTSNPDARLATVFRVLDSLPGMQRGSGAVICMASETLPLTERDFIIPLSMV